MNEKARLTNVVKKAMNREKVRHAEANRRAARQRKNLVDKLVGYGETLQKLASVDETMAGEIVFLSHRIKDAVREEKFLRESRKRHGLKRMEVVEYRKKLAKQVSQIREQISQTTKRLLL